MSKVNSIDLICKQEALNGDPKAIQYYFTRNLDHAGNERMLFFPEKWKENIFDCWQGTVKYSFFKAILPVVQPLTGDVKSDILDVPGFTDLLLIFQITTDKDLSDRNRQFKFKETLTRSMLIKS